MDSTPSAPPEPAPDRADADAAPSPVPEEAPLSLDAVTPRWSLKKKVLLPVLLLVALSTLVGTYVWTGIAPVKLWKNRGHAWEYLFGRHLAEDELAEARAEAERYPAIMAEGEARKILADRYAEEYRDNPEGKPGLFEQMKEINKLKEEVLAGYTEAEKQTMVDDVYTTLLDEKKGGYFPPETATVKLKLYGRALLETVAIAIWASLLAVLGALPLSLLAARNTLALIAPGDTKMHRFLRGLSVWGVRRFMDACRGFNELVMALIFVSVIGLGPFAGILALWIHTTGILGKVFSEAIEAIDPGQIEALASTGAGSTQTISFSVLPQIMPAVVSYSLLRFESNVRSAAILGFVGAGGIGFLLQDKMNGYEFREVCTMMLMIIAAVSLIDYACSHLRRRFI